MTDRFDNPMGLMGSGFAAFAFAMSGLLQPVFERMGLHVGGQTPVQGRGAVTPGADQLHHQPPSQKRGGLLCGQAWAQRLRHGV